MGLLFSALETQRSKRLDSRHIAISKLPKSFFFPYLKILSVVDMGNIKIL